MEVSKARRTIEKLILIFLIGLAAIVGLAPVCYFFGSPKLMYSFAIEGILFASVYLFSRKADYPVVNGPSPLEYVIRFLIAISFWGALGFFWFLIYGLLYWVVRLLNLLLTWLAFKPISVHSIAYYVSFGFALVCGIGISAAIAQNISTRLYSARVSSRVTSYGIALRAQTRTWLYLIATIAALGAMFVVLRNLGEGRGFWSYFFLQLVPYVAAYWVLGLSVRARRDYEIIDAITKLLKSLDYVVTFSLHSQDPTIDSLLSGLDMIATKENFALAIQIKTVNSSTAPLDWTHGSSLRQKAKALQLPEICNQVELVHLVGKEVRPLMVIVGREVDESLRLFAVESHVRIVVIDIEEVDRILTSEGAELKALAEKHFGDEASAHNSLGAPERSLSKEEGQWA